MRARQVAIVVAWCGCRFDADYRGGAYRCSDGVCPEGLSCVEERCVEPTGAIDAPAVDGPAAALTCGDPGELARGAEQRAGSTAGRGNLVSSSCDDGIFNGPDAVYRVTALAGDDLQVAIDTALDLDAYVLAGTCPGFPETPACAGAAYASPGVPLSLTGVAAGDLFIVVDSIQPAVEGDYQLTVQTGP
jgi:hypothetical protein